ncbi:TetR/AcrR family transcriptional regulator [Nocardiopsis changdeensis]|uniref:TetR/AcrR family transcriptional regulator C-terminal domain-containing protein n=1 Tax=Nocardiopsis changdeensis TaxID=2831969 RepID=A0ABX8BIV2_9ACTN|nr:MULTISPECIES: TetR/AcrR family transcriptional regulator [Nocardiopsis]QUX21942.1 TetR/AcrR family transcriptional regulator C-terminal domain-containing protein [Nocardiopsis changdeensis]QYX37878.1 TetR/AcrR family transcriptional regulator [Nocardiopsis sp. MT53]
MPRNTLTKPQIVRAAIDLLDEEGLDGLNMRALGRRLGAAPTAVYWHVENKDELMLLAGDHVWEEIPLPAAEPADWHAAARALATDLYAMFGRHPWLVQAFGSHLLYGPNKSRYDDRCLAVYEAAGLTAPEADLAAAAVFTYVLGNTLGAAATASLSRRIRVRGGDPEQEIPRAVEQATAVAREFPRLRERVDSPAAAYNAAPDSAFSHGLALLLDGIGAKAVR